MDDGHILPGVPTVVDGGNNDGNANRADGAFNQSGHGRGQFHQGYGEKLPLTEYPDTGIEYERFTGAIWSPRKASIILRGWMTLLSTQRHIGRP